MVVGFLVNCPYLTSALLGDWGNPRLFLSTCRLLSFTLPFYQLYPLRILFAHAHKCLHASAIIVDVINVFLSASF